MVVEGTDGTRDVAICFLDFDQMITFSAEHSRELAFLLMECADFIDPPFADKPNEESMAIFGPYEDDESDDCEDDDEGEDDGPDEGTEGDRFA